MEKNNLSKEEQENLENLISNIEAAEMAQVQDLFMNCNIAFQFAKTHSTYVKDWEKTRQDMVVNLQRGILPPGVSPEFHEALIYAIEEIIQKKLKMLQTLFQKKFGESIFNYLGPDGKTKKIFGIFG